MVQALHKGAESSFHVEKIDNKARVRIHWVLETKFHTV